MGQLGWWKTRDIEKSDWYKKPPYDITFTDSMDELSVHFIAFYYIEMVTVPELRRFVEIM